MEKHRYTIRLTKDAEPGTGLGGQIVNQFIPRDRHGNPMIPASHVKGLMRAALADIVRYRRDWPDNLVRTVFGAEDSDEPAQHPVILLEDAVTPIASGDVPLKPPRSRLVSRTAISNQGIALDSSLRTTEAIPSGTVFEGTIYSAVPADSVEGLAWQLSLLAISAVGSSRNRGGHCLVELERNPTTTNRGVQIGDLLKKLDAAVRNNQFAPSRVHADAAFSAVGALSSTTAIVELVFVADTPICCPEIPDKTNVISTGFSIPASAVQGLLLNRINESNSDLATRLFSSARFRCWPMHPCLDPQHDVDSTLDLSRVDSNELFERLPQSIRVSLSHKAAKFSRTEYTPDHFHDPSLDLGAEPFDYTKVPDGAPLKAQDGVLLFGNSKLTASGPILWRARDMAHHVSTHGVLDSPVGKRNERASGRNLFSVDAMAPLVWRGMIVLPSNAAEAVIESLARNSAVSLGKGRTVRGIGRLYARQINDFFAMDTKWADTTVLVLQSPVLIPEGEMVDEPADRILELMARSWLEAHGLPELKQDQSTWASAGLRFGWNRHRKTIIGNSKTGFQQAARVLLPGSVFSLKQKADNDKLQAALLAGFHFVTKSPETNDKFAEESRQRGFGALAVHPGKAQSLYTLLPRIPRIGKTDSPMKNALHIVLKYRTGTPLPSPSQIRAVEGKIHRGDEASRKVALEYMRRQAKRTSNIYFTWQPVMKDVERLLTEFDSHTAAQALEVLADIAIRRKGG